VGTLFAFAAGFGAIDVFLEFLLKGFLEKLSSFDEEEFFHVVECFAASSVIGDEIALVEQGIQFRVEKCPAVRKGRSGLHKSTSL